MGTHSVRVFSVRLEVLVSVDVLEVSMRFLDGLVQHNELVRLRVVLIDPFEVEVEADHFVAFVLAFKAQIVSAFLRKELPQDFFFHAVDEQQD